MHPHRRRHDQIELYLARSHSGQIRQAIIEPFDHRRPMQEHRATAKFFGRFDGDDRASEGYKSCRISPGPRADIEYATRNRRVQMQDGRMSICERDALIALEQLRKVRERASDRVVS